MQQEQESLRCDLPGIRVTDAELSEHEGASDGALSIIATDIILILFDAPDSDWIHVPVMLFFLVAFSKLKQTRHHLIMPQVLNIIQVDQDFVS